MTNGTGGEAITSRRWYDFQPVENKNLGALICDLARSFYDLGWVSGTGGGICIRDGDHVVIAPSAVQKERMRPDQMFTMAFDGSKVLVSYWTKIPDEPHPAILRASDGTVLRVIPMKEETGIYEWGDDGAIFYSTRVGSAENIWEVKENDERQQITTFPTESVFSYDYDRKRREFVICRGVEQPSVVMLKSASR